MIRFYTEDCLNKALVTKLIGGIYTFKDLETGIVYEGKARGKLRRVKVDETDSFNKLNTKKTKKEVKEIVLSPKVGDIVSYENRDGQSLIIDINQRKNELMRPDVANIDQVLLVFSCIRPDFSFTLLDKFLVILEREKLTPIIVVSKIDLIGKEQLEDLKQKLTHYEKYYQIYYINSKQRIGFDTLETIFKNKITVLAGQTGVGKSTLMNALIPDLDLKTQEISDALGRGKHTTRHSEIYEFGGGYIADTPGFSKIEFDFYDYKVLKDYFVDFKEAQKLCKFGHQCYHLKEPGCEVKNLVSNLEILPSRYDSYIGFVNELMTKKVKY